MTKILLGGVVVLVAAGAWWYYSRPESAVPSPQATSTAPLVEVVATDMDIPWDIAFLPEGGMLVTERTGHVIAINDNGIKTEIPVEGVQRGGEGGLLGVMLHPNFKTNRYLYLYMTAPGSMGETQNRVERFTYQNGTLTPAGRIIGGIPGAIYHDGGRMEFGPDGMLYITTGDATRSQIAQDKNSLGGKVLRLHDDGTVPADNPFGTAVWSYGHRNPQGLAWDSAGRLWETEHGRSGVTSGLDELNLITKGANYGWPTIEGDEAQSGMQTPVLNSGAAVTWAPASLVYLKGHLYFGGLMGKTLYEAELSGTHVVELKEHFKGEFGRIRTVRVGPDGMLYLTTSNTDGRGDPAAGDDKILRVNQELL